MLGEALRGGGRYGIARGQGRVQGLRERGEAAGVACG